MTAAVALNVASIYTALIGSLGRSRRSASFAIDDRGYLVAARADDHFVPAKGEAVDAFLTRIFASTALAQGDTLEATISNGVLVGVTVRHATADAPLVVLDLANCKDAWRSLVLVLANGYGRLRYRVAGVVLLLEQEDLTLRLERGEGIECFIERVRGAGVWRRGDLLEITSDGAGKLNTVRITRL